MRPAHRTEHNPYQGFRELPAASEIKPGARAVDDIDATVRGLRGHGKKRLAEVARNQDSHRPCYVREPEGIIAALAQQLN